MSKSNTLTSKRFVLRQSLIGKNAIITVNFKNGKTWSGIPIVAANMDTTGTIEIGKEFYQYDMLTCLSKHITEISDTTSINQRKSMALSFGMSNKDQEFLFGPETTFSAPHPFFCLDVANGYSENFLDFVRGGSLDLPGQGFGQFYDAGGGR